jgi:hypothetical protein
VVQKLLLIVAAVIAGVAVFGAFYWVQSQPPEIPSEVRTGSLWVRVTTANTTYTAGEPIPVELLVTNIGGQPLRRPMRIEICRMSSTEALRSYSSIMYTYAHGHETIPPMQEHRDVIKIAAIPELMPPDRYTFVIAIPQYGVSVAVRVTVE